MKLKDRTLDSDNHLLLLDLTEIFYIGRTERI